MGGGTYDHTLEYDALGRMSQFYNDNSGVTKISMWQGLEKITEDDGSDTDYYVNGPGAVRGVICRWDESDNDTYFYHYDHIGNVVAITDDSGDLVETPVQDAFGNVKSGTAAGLHLTTKEYYPDLGLYYFNARWYDPTTGRFISKAMMPETMEHPYLYCSSNPVSGIDPNGMQDFIPWDGGPFRWLWQNLRYHQVGKLPGCAPSSVGQLPGNVSSRWGIFRVIGKPTGALTKPVGGLGAGAAMAVGAGAGIGGMGYWNNHTYCQNAILDEQICHREDLENREAHPRCIAESKTGSEYLACMARLTGGTSTGHSDVGGYSWWYWWGR